MKRLKIHVTIAAVAGNASWWRLFGARAAGAGLAMAILAAAPPVHAADPPAPACGTADQPKACASLTTGVVTVVTRGERREYATAGVLAEAPLRGFSFAFAADLFAVQDGAAVDFGRANAFRAVKVEAVVSRRTGPVEIQAHGGTTLSIEGQAGAPLDPRQWDALLDVRLPVGDGHVALRAGHDGAVGGLAGGLDVVIPVANGPALVARYELPLRRDPLGRVPWVITAGARIRVASFRLGAAGKQ